MCGIFGFVGARSRPAVSVLDGLTYLEYRGYDSWGVAIIADSEVRTEKAVGAISGASTTLPDARSGLGHTRWATHGGVTEANAHPHTDCTHRFALIHNGIVENHQDLRLSLRADHAFLSQTDTEVLVHLLEETLETECDLARALMNVFRRVEGLSAVAVLDAVTGDVAVAKNGSPMVLGIGDHECFVASDPIALLDHTRSVVFLEDGQAALLSSAGAKIFEISSGIELPLEAREVNWDIRKAGLDGHAHYMIKEINEQPRVLRETSDRVVEQVRELADLIRKAKDVYLIGCGTAHHAALSGRYMLAEAGGRITSTAVASEMSLIYPLLGQDSLVVALSQSGETIDVLDAVRRARRQGATIAALVNAEGSSLDRTADLSIYLGCGPERCVLATKSYTAKLAVLHLMAKCLAGQMESGIGDLAEAGYRVESVLEREAREGVLREAARRIAGEQHMFVLGRHRNYPLALESALKIKEVSYLHAEGFPAGELKHGVIALVTYGTPCLVLAPDETFRKETLAAAAEVKARGATTIGFSPAPEPEFDIWFPVGSGPSAPFEIAAASQLLAYELALLRGCDPDKPRNLAKSVTVK